MKTLPQFRSATPRSGPLIAAVGVLAIMLGAGVALPSTTAVWTEYGSNPVYAPGKAYYPSVLKEGGTYTMWSESATGIQVSASNDGIHWTTAADASSGLTSPAHAVVKRIDSNTYRIWYWSGVTYAIGAIRTATSTDGLTWTGDQAITQVGATVITGVWPNWNYGSYGPCEVLYNSGGSATTVVPVDKASVWANRYVMYYDGTTGDKEFTGLAVSNDGVNWQGYNGGAAPVLSPSANSWDSNYATYGTVIRESGNLFEHWYCGGVNGANEGIGHAVSTDGINWTKDPNPIFSINDGVAWRANRTYTPMVIGNQMWFSGKDNSGNYTIGLATEAGTIEYTVSGWGPTSYPGPVTPPAGSPHVLDGLGYPGDAVGLVTWTGTLDLTPGTYVQKINTLTWSISYTYAGTATAWDYPDNWTELFFNMAAGRSMSFGTGPAGSVSQAGLLDVAWSDDYLSLAAGSTSTFYVPGYQIAVTPLAVARTGGSSFPGFPGGTPWVQPNQDVMARFDVTATHCLAGDITATPRWYFDGQNRIIITLQDRYGLGSVQALRLVNCTMEGQAYDATGALLQDFPTLSDTVATPLPAGTVKAVCLASLTPPNTTGSCNAEAKDMCGLFAATADPQTARLQIASGGEVQQVLTGILAAERLVSVRNGSPGLTNLTLVVNGQSYVLAPLSDGGCVSVDVGAAMVPGDGNTVVLLGEGAAGASAAISIGDSPAGDPMMVVPSVALQIESSAQGVQLSWSDGGAGYMLQSRSRLAPSDAWVNWPAAPQSVNGRSVLIVPAGGPAQFFRLYKP